MEKDAYNKVMKGMKKTETKPNNIPAIIALGITIVSAWASILPFTFIISLIVTLVAYDKSKKLNGTGLTLIKINLVAIVVGLIYNAWLYRSIFNQLPQ